MQDHKAAPGTYELTLRKQIDGKFTPAVWNDQGSDLLPLVDRGKCFRSKRRAIKYGKVLLQQVMQEHSGREVIERVVIDMERFEAHVGLTK